MQRKPVDACYRNDFEELLVFFCPLQPLTYQNATTTKKWKLFIEPCISTLNISFFVFVIILYLTWVL